MVQLAGHHVPHNRGNCSGEWTIFSDMGRKTTACFGGIFITKFEMDSFDIFVIFLLYGKENCHFLKGIFINHDTVQ